MKKAIITLLISLTICGVVYEAAIFAASKAVQQVQSQSPVGDTQTRITTALTNASVGCGSSQTLALATSSNRQYVAIVNDSANTVYIGLGNSAVGSNGIRLNANGGSYEINQNNLYTGQIMCIASSTSILTLSYK